MTAASSNKKGGNKNMKGIILAGGTGSRLWPLTAAVSKQMLPVGGVPMIYHPLNVLIKSGIKDILIIVSPEHSGRFMNMLEPLLRPRGINILSGIQEVPAGLPEAFTIGAPFIGDDNVTLILGDNIFQDTDTIANAIKNFDGGGHVFAKEVTDPERFGVATVSEDNIVTNIEEKPEKPESNLAVTGAYIYDNRVIEVAKKLEPSDRGELEIVDLHNYYLNQNELQLSTLKGAWFDAGTKESLREVDQFAADNDFVGEFDLILTKALEEGFARNKEMGKAQLHALKDFR